MSQYLSILGYLCILYYFYFNRGIVVNEGPGTSNQVKRQGTWADSEVEKTLKSILSFAKNFRGE